jgi:hypothetical protein
MVRIKAACVCLYGTSMLASMSYLMSTIRGLSLLVTHSLSKACVASHASTWWPDILPSMSHLVLCHHHSHMFSSHCCFGWAACSDEVTFVLKAEPIHIGVDARSDHALDITGENVHGGEP